MNAAKVMTLPVLLVAGVALLSLPALAAAPVEIAVVLGAGYVISKLVSF